MSEYHKYIVLDSVRKFELDISNGLEFRATKPKACLDASLSLQC